MKDNSNITTTKEKEYKKSINFGKIYLEKSSFISNEDNYMSEIKNDLQKKFSNQNEYTIAEKFDTSQNKIITSDEKLVFTKLSASNDHFFGTFSRISNTKDVLTDIIDNSSNEKIDPESIYFEHNTLFYIDFINNGISFIKTTYIKNVYPFLDIFLNHNNLLNVKIAPLIKTEKEITESVIKSIALSNSFFKVNSIIE